MESLLGQSCAAKSDAFKATVVEYWDERSATYSNGIWGELEGAGYRAWREVLAEKLGQPLGPDGFRRADGRPLRVLDLGCGPGFFSILLSNEGCRVDAVDMSPKMLERAAANVAEAGCPQNVRFHQGDVSRLPFVSDVYDAVVLRNVTWLMENPAVAYAEWLRVLKPGGKLLVFDANWYTYLADAQLDARRVADQVNPAVLEWDDNAFATARQEERCERIAARLPLTYQQRPAWDLATLPALGFSSVSADTEVYRRVWTPGEQTFYGTSPLFCIEAVK